MASMTYIPIITIMHEITYSTSRKLKKFLPPACGLTKEYESAPAPAGLVRFSQPAWGLHSAHLPLFRYPYLTLKHSYNETFIH